MKKNEMLVPGILEGSKEGAYNAIRFVKENLNYVEFYGHQFVSTKYRLLRSNYGKYLLMHVISGCIEYITCEKKGRASAGQVMLIETGLPHGYSALETSEIKWFHFAGAYMRPVFDYIISQNNDDHTFNVDNNHGFIINFNSLYDAYETHNSPLDVVASARLTELLGLLLEGRKDSVSYLIRATIRYIEKYYKEPITLNQLAEQTGLSVSRFSTLFKKETGYSAYQYILNCRLQASRLLLTGTTQPIHEIAEHVGFSDSSTYIFSFKNKYQCTPLQYRNKNSPLFDTSHS